MVVHTKWFNLMLEMRTLLLLAGLITWSLPAPASTLVVNVIDVDTGQPVPDAQVIIQEGQPAEPFTATIVQKNRQFDPQLLVIAKGSEVEFPNLDNTLHHVYSFSPAKMFDIELYADQPEAPVVFDKTGVVELGCNIHDRMQAFILVVDSGLRTATDASGQASIVLPEAITQGDQITLNLWHPRLTDTTKMRTFTLPLPLSGPADLSIPLVPKPSETGRLDRLQNRLQDI